MKEKIKLKHHLFHLMEELKSEESIRLFSTFVGGRGADINEVNEITYISKDKVDSPVCYLLMFCGDVKFPLIQESKLDDFEKKLNELKNGIENVEDHICFSDGNLLKSYTLKEIKKNIIKD